MTPGPKHHIGQEQLSGMESTRIPDRRPMGAMTNFVRVATPEYAGLRPIDYADITPRMMELVAADELESSLYDRSDPVRLKPPDPTRDFGVAYTPEGERTAVTVFLTPREFDLIPRSVPGLARAAISRALTHRPQAPTTDRDMARATRSGVHALETRAKGTERYLPMLDEDIERLRGLLKASGEEVGGKRIPHWWATKKEIDMLSETTWFREHILCDLLEATSHHRAWDETQFNLARRSVERRLYFERETNKHILYWQDLLHLSLRYNGHKSALFQNRLAQSIQVTRHAPNPSQT